MRAVTVVSRICSFLGWLFLVAVLYFAGAILIFGHDLGALAVIFLVAAFIGALRKWSGKFIGTTFACAVLTLGVVYYHMASRGDRFYPETHAIKAIQTIHAAQVKYKSQYGRYATSLAELGPPPSGAPTAAAADLIDSYLARGEKSGYKFFLAGSTDGYTINANPMKFGVSGSRTFYSDQTQTFYENLGPEPATAHSKELK